MFCRAREVEREKAAAEEKELGLHVSAGKG
jgi:hypothetical protein